VQIAFGASGRLVEAGPAGIELKVDGSVSADASAPAAASAASA
jgi:hypothetical protein